LESIQLLQAFDTILDAPVKEINSLPRTLATNISPLMKLMSSSKDRAILQFVLSNIYSNQNLHYMLGYTSSTIKKLTSHVNDFLVQSEEMEGRCHEDADREVENVISQLEKVIREQENCLERKRKRLATEEIEDLDFDVQIKKQRLERLTRSRLPRKKLAKRKFKAWKQTLKSQRGKNKGKFRIDRGAEKAIFEVLEEQLKAHHRRWGDEGTGYLESEKRRLHKKDMRRIANRYLASQKKKLVKSCETVRSWGRCRNKRSRQAKQHRGTNLWAYARSQKTWKQRHINVHYNRAHIKNYTRFAFSERTANKDFVIRRALDDKAYVRCGTSEGFSRPLHRPVQITDAPFELPSSDYPDTVGYVSPGVILLVNEMKETSHNETDAFSITDATVTVTCKPKHVYPSTATNWQNDIFAVRYFFPEEHEVTSNGNSDMDNLPRNIVSFLVWIKDSLLQYDLMSLREDYIRVYDGGDHLVRERRRNFVLNERLSECKELLMKPTSCSSNPLLQEIFSKTEILQGSIKKIGKFTIPSLAFF
jgi:hypothetical protein